MSEYTKGPWIFESAEVIGKPFVIYSRHDDGFVEYVCTTQNVHFAESRNQPNARLIAAAPELLEACQLALNAFERNDCIDWSVLSRAIEKAVAAPSAPIR